MKIKSISQFKEGYGIFPYIELFPTVQSGNTYVQIPIHFVCEEEEEIDVKKYPGTELIISSNDFQSLDTKELIEIYEEELIALTQWIIDRAKENWKKEFTAYLVLKRDKSYFFTYVGEYELQNSIPSGGWLHDQQHNLLAYNRDHYLDELNDIDDPNLCIDYWPY